MLEVPNAISEWYRENYPLYDGLTKAVHRTVTDILAVNRVDYLAVTSRTKTLDSLAEKMDRKEYDRPESATDISGVRVITYIESDVRRVGELIAEAFSVHPEKSPDKGGELKPDQIGYRSVHHVCELGERRLKLPELRPYKGLLFEVQVRTALQHAWAEIEHDRNYKFSGVLPSNIRRRLYLLAGMLEIVDREFVSISGEIDAYGEELKQSASTGSLGPEEITSLSLGAYLPSRVSEVAPCIVKPSKPSSFEGVVGELGSFGVTTISQLDSLLSGGFLKALRKYVGTTTEVGLLRKAMMYADVDRFFDRAWGQKWREMNASTKKLLEKRYGSARLEALMRQYGLNPKPSK